MWVIGACFEFRASNFVLGFSGRPLVLLFDDDSFRRTLFEDGVAGFDDCIVVELDDGWFGGGDDAADPAGAVVVLNAGADAEVAVFAVAVGFGRSRCFRRRWLDCRLCWLVGLCRLGRWLSAAEAGEVLED